MKKDILWRIVLVLLPALTFGLETMPDSVTAVLESGNYNQSFFGSLPDGTLPSGLAMAGMLTVATAVVALVYAIVKKAQWLTVATWVSLAAATLSVLPVLIQSDPLVLPNVLVTVLLMMEALLAYMYKQIILKDGKKKVVTLVR